MNTFISLLLASRNQAHVFHWQTQSYATHKTLNEYYDNIIDLVDELVEGYQGKYGVLKNFMPAANIIESENKNTVIADVRFANECDFIRSKGGLIVRVVRGPEPKWYDEALLSNTSHNHYQVMDNFPDIHYSEWAWIGQKMDYIVDNNETHTDLVNRVNDMLQIVT